MNKNKKELAIPKPRPTMAQREAAKSEMDQLLRDRFVRNFFGMPSSNELIEGNNYVIGADGLYMVRKNRVGLFTTRIAETNENKIPLVGNGKQPVEGFVMTIENRIPYEFLLQTAAFFRKVYQEKKGAEAVVQIFYNAEEKSYFFNIDEQGVSGGAAEMDRDAELETNHVLVADIHSHNGMAAFFSSTDNRDEKEARIYGVMGRFDQPWPEMKFRAGDGKGGWMELSVFQAFETPDVGVVEVPDEWMDKVHTPSKYRQKSKYYRNQPRHHVEERPAIDPSYYDRYVPHERRARTSQQPLFGKVGTTEQDNFIYPVERWEEEVGWPFDEIEHLPFDCQQGDVSLAIESLIVNAEVLNDDEAKSMWLSLFNKLDSQAKEIVKQVVSET
jgi:PRTRC genetic system protein A